MKTSLRAFTLVEMLVVMAIIGILAGLVLGGAGFAQKKAARDRAKSEIQAMEAALEGYKSDNAIYPRTAVTDALDATKTTSPSSYKAASLELYKALSGDENLDRSLSQAEKDNGGKSYMELKPGQLTPKDVKKPVEALVDPFGNPYGYSTIGAKAQETTPPQAKGNNTTFDLWSTGGKTGSTDADKANWITNW